MTVPVQVSHCMKSINSYSHFCQIKSGHVLLHYIIVPVTYKTRNIHVTMDVDKTHHEASALSTALLKKIFILPAGV